MRVLQRTALVMGRTVRASEENHPEARQKAHQEVNLVTNEPMDTPCSFLHELRCFRSSDAKRMWRESIKERDGYRCVYCGSSEHLTIDHVRPQSMGGPTTAANCVTACRACNQLKGSMSRRGLHSINRLNKTCYFLQQASLKASSHLTLRKFEGIALDATFTTCHGNCNHHRDVLVALDVLIASDRQDHCQQHWWRY